MGLNCSTSGQLEHLIGEVWSGPTTEFELSSVRKNIYLLVFTQAWPSRGEIVEGRGCQKPKLWYPGGGGRDYVRIVWELQMSAQI